MADVELTPAQKRKIKRAVAALNDVRQELQQENPDYNINWYLEDTGNLNLMEADSHDRDGSARYDKVIEIFGLDNSSGGGW
ncbi:hypothetical protein [Aeromonas jandaei]|uniref:hypothetical protein n=1 Tax=Aeromonas jandaei TaxID=650 RepID=UPI003B9E3FB4